MKDVVICVVIGILGFLMSGLAMDLGFEYSGRACAVIAVIFLGCGVVAYFDRVESKKTGQRMCQSSF